MKITSFISRILGGRHKVKAVGTPNAEYIEKGAPTSCGNCRHQTPKGEDRGACDEFHVLLDVINNKIKAGPMGRQM